MGRVFELYEDFSPSWLTQGLSLDEDFISIMENRGFDLYKDLSPLWQTEGLSKMKSYHYYGK